MSPEVTTSIRLAIGLVFAFAAMQKLREPRLFITSVADFGLLPASAVGFVATLLILLESAIAISHLLNFGLFVTVPAGAALLGIFILATGWVLVRGDSVPCSCFGSSQDELVSWKTMARLIPLVAAESIVWINSSASSYGSPLGIGGDPWVLELVSAVLGIVLASWILTLPELHDLLVGCKTCRAKTKQQNHSI